jgi:hypothetical protein
MMAVPDAYLLHKAVSRCDHPAVERLIAEGHDLNALDDLGMTPLHCAVYGGYAELVRVLLQAGADPNRMSSDRTPALWHAQDDFGMYDIAAILKSYGAVSESAPIPSDALRQTLRPAVPDVGAEVEVADDKFQWILMWGVCGTWLGGLGGSILMLRGGWHSASTVAENVTFVIVNAFVGTALGLVAGWFAVPKQQDLRKPTWWL